MSVGGVFLLLVVLVVLVVLALVFTGNAAWLGLRGGGRERRRPEGRPEHTVVDTDDETARPEDGRRHPSGPEPR
jgi:hypothetical protein